MNHVSHHHARANIPPDLLSRVGQQHASVVRQVLWVLLALVALTNALNLVLVGFRLEALAANTALLGLTGGALWLAYRGRTILALGLVIGFVTLVATLPLFLYGVRGTQGAWFLLFLPAVLAALTLRRRALFLTGGFGLAAFAVGYASQVFGRPLLVAPFDSPPPAALALQAGVVLVLVLFLLERFGFSLQQALVAAAAREASLTQEIAERRKAEARLSGSEARYRKLVQNLPNASLYLVDPELRITLAEGTAMRRHGLTPADLEGKTVAEVLGDDLYRVIGPHYEATLEGKDSSGEVHFGGVDYSIRTSPLYDRHGQLEGGIALVLDITHEKRMLSELQRALAAEARASKQVRAERQHLQDLFEQAPAMMASTTGPTHVFTQANWEYLRLTGRHDVVGKTVLEVFPELASTDIPSELDRVYETGRAFVASEQLIPIDCDGDGVAEDHYYDVIYQAVRDADGAVTGLLFLAHDVTEQVSARQELETRQQKLERLNQELRSRVGRLAALRAVDLAITGSADPQVVMAVVLEQVVRRLEVDAAQILLYQPATQDLRPAARIGFADGTLPRHSLPVDRSLEGQAARASRYIPDIRAPESGFLPRPHDQHEGFVAYFGTPIAAKGELLGVLELFHRSEEPRTDDWFEFAEALALQTAIALHNARLLENLTTANEQLRLAYDTTIVGWARALDLKDEETAGHSQRVTDLTVALARRLGVGEADLVHVRRGALLHDIGKMGVPDSILLKPGKLSDAEWEVMQRHTIHARDLLTPIPFLAPALDIPYAHHEKWDGSGYPRGLAGEAIPLAARIFAVVDVYDALTSDRPYRKAWSVAATLEHIRQQAGRHFDPAVVAAFCEMMSDAPHKLPVASG